MENAADLIKRAIEYLSLEPSLQISHKARAEATVLLEKVASSDDKILEVIGGASLQSKRMIPEGLSSAVACLSAEAGGESDVDLPVLIKYLSQHIVSSAFDSGVRTHEHAGIRRTWGKDFTIIPMR